MANILAPLISLLTRLFASTIGRFWFMAIALLGPAIVELLTRAITILGISAVTATVLPIAAGEIIGFLQSSILGSDSLLIQYIGYTEMDKHMTFHTTAIVSALAYKMQFKSVGIRKKTTTTTTV